MSFLELVGYLFAWFLAVPLLFTLVQEVMIKIYPIGCIVVYNKPGSKIRYWVVVEHCTYSRVYLQPFSRAKKTMDLEPSMTYNHWNESHWGTEEVKYGKFRKISQLERLIHFS